MLCDEISYDERDEKEKVCLDSVSAWGNGKFGLPLG